ncbi:MAG: prepilin-type N-terminal cleavage/methylation domain-containing protein [Fusobacterium sp.]|nr:prepilin-type N-terminal cleavage/methylation domain-containing protein [Fusobacterium sp.]
MDRGGGTAEQAISRGFTMAEILLSLTIIGVVAAITLPSLTGNINERTWNTQRKALYARFSQAIALMPALNGFGSIGEDASGSITEDNVAETFITAGLSKVLKINNICDGEHLADCGVTSKIVPFSGTAVDFPTKWSELNAKMVSASQPWGNTSVPMSFSQIDAKAAAFETANGETVVVYYNKNCQSDMNETRQYMVNHKICANFIYDLNGTKGPNTVGKDIGVITALYPSDTQVVMPLFTPKASASGISWQNASKTCSGFDSEYRLPNREELASVWVNNKLLAPSDQYGGSNVQFWTSTRYPNEANKAYYLYFGNGTMYFWDIDDTSSCGYLCVRRN